MSVKLQFALDDSNSFDIFSIARESVLAGIDILEVGTSIIKRYGIEIVKKLHNEFPMVPLCADGKMIDFPDLEITDLFNAGATYATAMIIASNENIIRSIEIANNFSRNIFFSTMGYPNNNLAQRILEISSIGGTFFIAHGSGRSLEKAFDDLINKINIIVGVQNIRIIMAGGINKENINSILKYSPEIIIIGRGIYESNNISLSIKNIKEILNRGEQ